MKSKKRIMIISNINQEQKENIELEVDLGKNLEVVMNVYCKTILRLLKIILNRAIAL